MIIRKRSGVLKFIDPMGFREPREPGPRDWPIKREDRERIRENAAAMRAWLKMGEGK